MKEACDGFACIEEVDEDTFARFVEYCYTGDYPAAEHVVVLDASSIQHEVGEVEHEVGGVVNAFYEPDEEELRRSFGLGPARGKRGKRNSIMASGSMRRQEMWHAFTDVSWNTPAQEPKPPQYSARANREACEDYTDVFLSHARLYVFADTYDIERLRVLSMQKLHESLVNFTLFAERTTDIALLLQYAYEHTPERTGTMDDLRELLMRYVCCYLEEIRCNDVFTEILKAENNLSVDLLELLVPNLDSRTGRGGLVYG